MTHLRTAVAVLAALFLPGAIGYAQQPPNLTADLTPMLQADGVHAGEPARAAVRVALGEGLHANSNKPRDPLLIPMELTVDPPPGVTVTEIVFPAPTDLQQTGQPEPLSVFEREFAIGVAFEVAGGVPPGDLAVPANLRYQACNDVMCFRPMTLPFQWTMRVVPAGVDTRPIAVHAERFAGIAFGTGEKPGPRRAERVERPVDLSNTPDNVAVALASLDRFEVAGTTNYVSTADFLQFIRDAEAGVANTGMFEGRGPLAILLIVLAGGLALNLTPCVLPMIPINLAIIGAGARAGSRRRGLLLGGAYGAAMAVVYGALGLIVILTAGTFGTINSSPWFNAGIAALFVVLALAMFDVITIDFSGMLNRFHVGDESRGSLLVAFGMGAVAALLAGACVAPVVIQVVLLSSDMYAAGTGAALALPFVLGIGMALPWPIAGAGISALPRPGAWMVRVKQAFGLFILATAIYYGYTAYELFANRWVDPNEVRAGVEEQLREGWYPSLAAGLEAAEREGKPVLIDFWATWCKNCLVMDRTTFKDPEVRAALADYVKVKFQAEDMSVSPAKEALDRFDAIGLPTYVILKPKS